MANIRILYDLTTFDAATITSSSEENSDLADDNVVHDFLSKPWRATGDSAEWVKFDLGSAVQMKCLGIFGANFTSAATVTHEAHASDSFGSPTYTQQLTIPTNSDSVVIPKVFYFFDQTLRWHRITIADAANPDTYTQIPRIVAGTYWEPTRQFSDDFEIIGPLDPSEGGADAGAQASFVERAKYHIIRIRFNLYNRAMFDKLQAWANHIGRTNPVIIALHPTDYPSKDTFYCHLTSNLQQMRRLAVNFSSVTLEFQEKVKPINI